MELQSNMKASLFFPAIVAASRSIDDYGWVDLGYGVSNKGDVGPSELVVDLGQTMGAPIYGASGVLYG